MSFDGDDDSVIVVGASDDEWALSIDCEVLVDTIEVSDLGDGLSIGLHFDFNIISTELYSSILEHNEFIGFGFFEFDDF